MATPDPRDTTATTGTTPSGTTAGTAAGPAAGAGPGGRLAGYRPIAHAVLRIGAGLLFMQHGAQKLFGWFGGVDGGGATAELVSLFGLAGILEFFGGLMIVLGLFTVPVAVILLIEMLWAYFQVHIPQGLVPIQNQGELALLYALLWVYFATAGAGPASLDQRIRASGIGHRASGIDA